MTTWLESSATGIEGSEYWGRTSQRIAYRTAATTFEYQDYLGTERVRADYSGNVLNRYASLPFGDAFSGASNPVPTRPISFCWITMPNLEPITLPFGNTRT